MRYGICLYILLALCCVPSCAEDNSQKKKNQTPASQPAPMPGVLKLPHMTVHPASRRIVLQAEACQSQYGLEFFLCRRNTKEYESLLRTDARGVDLHAALLAMGLTPGKPARWTGIGPDAKFMPPQGPELKITLRWKAQGKIRTCQAGDWLATATSKSRIPPKKWIFIGSGLLPDGRYIADLPEEGGLISAANMSSAVIDVPFESTTALDDREFLAKTQAMPTAGTAVEVIIEPLPGAENSPHARAWIEIDHVGQVRVKGQPVNADALTQWADRFTSKHSLAQIIVRANSHALVADLRGVRDALQLAGVIDVQEIYLPPEAPILPRSPHQVDQAILWWADQFQRRSELLFDPSIKASETVRQIQAVKQADAKRKQLLADYADQLKALLNQHKPSNPTKTK